MHSYLVFLCFSLLILFFPLENHHTLFARENTQNYPSDNFCTLKKKIVIFTFEKGGHGHKAASKSINDLLSADYDIKTIDLSQYLQAGRCVGGWEIYDKSLRGGWIRSTNAVASYIFPIYLKLHEGSFQTKVSKLLEKELPDLVISVIPYFDELLFKACQEIKRPLLISTTDGDLINWVVGFDQKPKTNIKVTIGFESLRTRDLLIKNGINNNDILLTGFPIRKDFLEVKDKKAIQEEWHIPQDKFTVLLLMGGVGSIATYRYAKRMSRMNLPIHLIACVGRDLETQKRLELLQKKSKVTMTIVPFTQRISDLMAVSDLLVTKAGPGSINEAIHMNLPMLIDKTSPLLRWEKENLAHVERNNFGTAITSLRKLQKELKKFIENKDYYRSFKQSMYEYPKLDFDTQIKQLVQQMCPIPDVSLPYRLDFFDVQNQKI